MDLGLAGRVVLVTGGAGGIGDALVRRFRAEGATVVAHGVGGPREELSDPEVVDRLFARVVGEHGRVDVLLANAGKWPEPARRLDETPVADQREAIDDNLWTAMLTARAFLGSLAAVGPAPDAGAAIVFTGSTAGRFGEHGHVAYATAKAALRGLALTLKNEIVHLDPAGRVNVVEPGWTATPAVASRLDPQTVERVTRTMALRRVADVDDIAAAVLFLASPAAARHVTGEVITVAGGMEGRTLWG
jgi:3-oxoacyl-[acyl-carrier protein] reductase